MMNSTAIYNFLKPRKIAKAISQATSRAKNYIDSMIEALTLLADIEDEERKATNAEIEVLNQFDGYGKATKALNPSHDRHNELKEALERIHPQAFEMAQRGVLTSYYTNDSIVNAMWRCVLRLGVQDGNAIEPAAGMGAFIKNCPSQFKGKFHAIELDPVTSKLLNLTTNSNCNVHNKRYEDTKLNNLQYSLAIGNPPYGAITARSKEFGKINILPYFMLRSLRELHEGGIMAFVVSTWLMDSQDTSIREQIAEQANLVASARIPSNQFNKKGASGVTTDILIFQKTSQPDTAPLWIETNEELGFRINSMFHAHPERIIGELKQANEFSYSTCEVVEQEDFEDRLNEVLDAQSNESIFFMPTVNKGIAKKEAIQITPADLDQIKTNNELYIEDGKVYQFKVSYDSLNMPEYKAIEQDFSSDRVKSRFIAYIEVKDALKALLQAENKFEDDNALSALRTDLNIKHQYFCKKFGPLSRTSNKTKLRSCSQFLRTRALELNYIAANKEEKTDESFTDAPVLKERVFKPHTRPTSAKNPTEAAIISTLEYGRIKANYLANLLDTNDESAIDMALADGAIFLNPKTEQYELNTTYLSGNIYQKIDEVIAKKDPDLYSNNLKALELVKPTPLNFDEIKISIGATWTGGEIYSEFVTKLLGPKTKVAVVLVHGKWEMTLSNYDYGLFKKYSTDERSFEDILLATLNTKPIVVRKSDSIGTYIDRQATFEANEKAEEIINEFEDWLPNCQERRITLTDRYNRIMNGYVVPDFEEVSKHITIDNCTMTARPHQRRAIARAILTNASLGDMAVGSGKTLTLQSIAMKLKEIYGPSHTNVIAMPNPLVEQFSSTFLETFPAANILTIPDKTPTAQREELLNIAMTGSFDCIVMPETTLKALEAPREMADTLLTNEISDLRDAALKAADYNLDGRAQKRLERMIEKKEEQLETLREKEEMESITFSDLNVDFLAFDEAQSVKNLNFFTNMSGVRGLGNPTGSKRAYDFFIKARHTLSEKGKVFLCTGTTIANSITEIVTWLRMLEQDFMNPEILQVDGFIKTFAAPETDLEIDATGRNLKPTTSLKRFQNLPELLRVYRTIAEVISLDQLKKQLPPLADGRPAIPPFKNGGIQTEILDISPEQNEYFLTLVEKAKKIDKKNNMLAIMDLARKASLDLRHIDPNARTQNNVCDKAIENIYRIYKESRAYNGTQLVFCDRSISTRHRQTERKTWIKAFKDAERGDIEALKRTAGLELDQVLATLGEDFSIYDEIERRLTDLGLKVAIVHDYHTDALKNKLKRMLNKGEIDVCIGSTMKIGTGFNVNERLIALHNLDLPLRSGDYFQRIGRIERQNSKAYIEGHYDSVYAFNYCTERTLDSWFLNLLNKKNNYIIQFTNGDLNGQREYTPDTEVIDFASLSALVTGNDSFIRLARSRVELKKLQSKKRSITSRAQRAKENLEYCNSEIKRLESIMPKLEEEQATACKIDTNSPTYSSSLPLEEKASSNFKNAINTTRKGMTYRDQTPKTICKFGEMELQTMYENHSIEYQIVGNFTHRIVMFGYHNGPVAVYNAAERLIQKLRTIADEAKERIITYRQTLAQAEKEQHLTFDHDERIAELKATISELEEEISENEEKERQKLVEEHESKAA
ncbi:Eco57I restriction-modification methylase domain-containing protein [Vibrio owensii]|uniref:Eco57I restriction-modification methylase domain-containing protein n=1 Tax=Vibrio owensii TaxID=696485 RepID=UPI0018F2345D|nr:DEAD/DEAH box helicase family protein [Vibrio owensii]